MWRAKVNSQDWIAIAAICLCLADCGEVGFKRGGGGDEFAAAQQDCRQQSSDEAAYSTCLAKAGWSVANLDPAASADLSSAPVSTPAPDMSPMPSGAPRLAAAASASTAPVAGNPREIVSVGSWWKAGGGQADLQASVNDCVAVLGPSHEPDPAYNKVTRALYHCLSDHGWHGIGHAG